MTSRNPARIEDDLPASGPRQSAPDPSSSSRGLPVTLDAALARIAELEQTRQELSARSQRLEAALNRDAELLNAAPSINFWLDRAGIITRLSLAAVQLLGRKRERLLGSYFSHNLVDAMQTEFISLLRRAMSSGAVRSGEFTLLRKGSRQTRVNLRVAPFPDAMGYQVVLDDVSEFKAIEATLRLSEERWKMALDASSDGVWDWSVRTGTVLYSRRFAELFGYADGGFGRTPQDWQKRIHPDDQQRVMDDLNAHLAGTTERFFSEHRVQCADGRWKWVLARGVVVMRSNDGMALRVIGTHVDITQYHENEQALRTAHSLQQAVFDSLFSHIAVLDHRAHILQTNAAWKDYARRNRFAEQCGVAGVSYRVALSHMMSHNADMVESAWQGILSVAQGRQPHYRLEYDCPAPTQTRWFILRVALADDAQGDDGQGRIVVSHQDVTRLKAAELANLKLANVDALTGALSRRYFLDLAEQELVRAIRYQLPLMVLMLDLDYFKRINDEHGHAVGDAVLQSFVHTVRSVLRESDVIGRLGGEEFSVLLPNTAREGGQALAQRIVEAVRASPVPVEGKQLPYTVSLGASCLTRETAFSELLRLADAALYSAKRGGRDRVTLHTPDNP